MSLEPVLIAGQWRPAQASGSFQADNPTSGERLPPEFPVSSWADCDSALAAAADAAVQLRATAPEKIAQFLLRMAELIEGAASDLVASAHAETGLPVKPRLADAELPRTTGQLSQAAEAAREGS